MMSFMPFAASGRLRVMCAIGPDWANSMAWYSSIVHVIRAW
jgi:hypothetical protein